MTTYADFLAEKVAFSKTYGHPVTDDVPPPDHALDACDKTHELRCRCDCHERSAADDGLRFL